MLKLLHADRNLPALVGKGYVFNGLTHDSYVVEYQEKADCMSHDTYEKIIEKLLDYWHEGIRLGENLIITFETKEKPLTAGQVQAALDTFFGNKKKNRKNA
jgi:hypothetical protein